MQPCSPPEMPMVPCSPIMESANSESLQIPITNIPQQRALSALKFSIEKIMEPDGNKGSLVTTNGTSLPVISCSRAPAIEPNDDASCSTDDSDVEIISTSSSTFDSTYDSAFKKYIPTAAGVFAGLPIVADTMHQFVTGHSHDLISQYPLLYYPNQLMCAAAQYAALRQQPGSLLTNASPRNPFNVHVQSNISFQTESTLQRNEIDVDEANRELTSKKNIPALSSKDQLSPTSNIIGCSANSSKQKTFACPECGKIFNAHYNLTRHMPVHTGAR